MENWTTIDKVAKSKNNDQEDDKLDGQLESRQIIKPVVFRMTPRQIQFLVCDVIRPAIGQFTQNKQMSNEALSTKFNPIALKRIRQLPGFDKDDIKSNRFGTHALRKIYANFLYENFAVGISRNAWIAKVLGHEPTSVTASLSYTTTSISQMPKFLKADDMRTQIAIIMQRRI